MNFKCRKCYNWNMKTFQIANDIKIIRELYELTQDDFANQIGLSRSNIIRYEKEQIMPNNASLEAIYGFCYRKGFRLNKAKYNLITEQMLDSVVLLHGSKNEIKGDINFDHCKSNSDFGRGFYLGETYEQASSWVAENSNSSVYCFYIKNKDNLKFIEFKVDRNWMYAILYYRNAFDGYLINEEVKKIVEKVESVDFVIAPIADNRIYSILSMFSNGLITDEQCLHALNANGLGKQYVMKSKKAVESLQFIERFYLCREERQDILVEKEVQMRMDKNKADLAIATYRRKGQYFDEIFKKQR